MSHLDSHLSDHDLLMEADGELSSRRSAEIQEHLRVCWSCRTRKTELDRAVVNFVEHYHRELDPRVPPMSGARAELLHRLAAQPAAPSGMDWRFWTVQGWSPRRMATSVAIGLALILFGTGVMRRWSGPPATLMPDATLTPGTTRPISRTELCAGPEDERDPVPASLAREVFLHYGIRDPKPRAYEVDYLITPALGGSQDVHNLWPQPYATGVWNSHVKDALEDHLRRMVCSGQLDLSEAQREIAGNWIEAYKKYFNTTKPLQAHAHFARDPAWE